MDNVERWMDIPHYNGKYQVSTGGRVLNVKRQKILKGKINNHGYIEYNLIAPNGKHKFERGHRLVALTFIPNPNNLPQINHKNEIKTDNRLENLEGCTAKYNTLYSSYKGKGQNNGMNKPGVKEKHKIACLNAHDFESCRVLDKETDIIYRSLREAERETGIYRKKIKKMDRFYIYNKGE